MIKPISPNILLSKIAIFIELFKKTEALRQKTTLLEQQTNVLQRQAAQMEAINAELRVSEERFRLLCTCSPLGVFVTDTQGHCIYANPRFQTICGAPSPDSTKQSWLACVHPAEATLAQSTWTTYIAGGQEYFQEFRLQTGDDSPRWVSIRSARLVSEQNTLLGYVGTLEDITERKQAEAAAAQILREQVARQEAENANRMKDDFIAVLSHELRTPLNAILGWSNLLQAGNLPPGKVEFAISTIERNAMAQKQLIEDIMDVSQIVRGKLPLHCQPLDLVGVVQAALETVRPSLEAKAIALTHNLQDHPRLEVIGDALRLQQVIWNLLSNAIKFTPDQGQIDLQISVATEVPQALSYADSPPAAYAQLQVTDTGLGIDNNFLPYIFDRFRQANSSTTRAQGGLGLGLAIVQHLIEQHQGQIWATSPGLNQGTTFTVALPLVATPGWAGQAPFAPTQATCLEADLSDAELLQGPSRGISAPPPQAR